MLSRNITTTANNKRATRTELWSPKAWCTKRQKKTKTPCEWRLRWREEVNPPQNNNQRYTYWCEWGGQPPKTPTRVGWVRWSALPRHQPEVDQMRWSTLPRHQPEVDQMRWSTLPKTPTKKIAIKHSVVYVKLYSMVLGNTNYVEKPMPLHPWKRAFLHTKETNIDNINTLQERAI
jgi:hypothetical protein